MGLLYCIKILTTLLMSVLGFSPDAKADACQYQARDYQGNNRVLTDYSGNAIERYDYYPYGGLFGEVNPEQWRLYGGKELQTMNGLNLYDFHARWQDYATCWFTTQDPLAEKTPWNSPYGYCSGNPINKIDPTGMTDYYNQNGKFVLTVDDGEDAKMMLFINSRKEEDAQQAIEERRYTTVPDETVLEAMDEVYKKTEDSGNEHGFIVGQQGTVSTIVGVTSDEISNAEWHNAQKDIAENNDKISYDVHSHPEQKSNETEYYPTTKLSDDDKNSIVGNMPGVILGYEYKPIYPSNQIGGYPKAERYRAIMFFNSYGPIARYEYNIYKKSVKKINKHRK